MSIALNLAILIGVGLALFLFVGQWMDAAIHRIAVRPDDSATAPNPRRRFILNIVRPVFLTVVIFGGGMFTIAALDLRLWSAICAGAWFFFLTQIACLAGRKSSLNEAGWAMVATMAVIIGAYVTIQSHR